VRPPAKQPSQALELDVGDSPSGQVSWITNLPQIVSGVINYLRDF